MNRDLVYLRHMLDAINKVEKYVSVGQRAFLDQSHWQDAVIRQLEVLGEASKRLSPDLKAGYPDIPWRRIAGLRDVLIHDYFGVDLQVVWSVTKQDLPPLQQKLSIILSSLSHDPGS